MPVTRTPHRAGRDLLLIAEPGPVAGHPAREGDAAGDPGRLGPVLPGPREEGSRVTATADRPLAALPAHPPHAVVSALHQAFLARAIYTAVRLGVLDELARGPRGCAELAGQLQVAAEPLHQVVRGLAGAGLLRSRGGAGPDEVFALTPAGETLVDGHPSGARDLVLVLQGPAVADCLRVLPERVTHGLTGPEIALGGTWSRQLRTDGALAAAVERMTAATRGGEYLAVAAAYDMDWAWNVLDVGGGLGGLTLELLAANDHLQGAVYDLPAVVTRARRAILRSGFAHRCTAIEGDFLDSVPHGADAYLLSSVLHDHADDDCVRILRAVAAGMTPGSRLLIVEHVLPEGDEPHPGRALDLQRLVLTQGRERTATEYGRLLERAGLRIRTIVPTASPVSVVEAEPAR